MGACLTNNTVVGKLQYRSFHLGHIPVLITPELLGYALAREEIKSGENEATSEVHDPFIIGAQHVSLLDDVFEQCKGSYDTGIHCFRDSREGWFCFCGKEGKWFPVALRCDYDMKRYTACLLSSSLQKHPYSYSLDGKPYVDIFSIGRIGLLLFASIAVYSSGFIVHGALLQDEQSRGILICGYSGSGKTTIASKLAAQGYRVIHDDRVVIYCLEQGKYIAYPLHWDARGNSTPSKGVPIERLFFLDRKEGNESDISRVPQHIAYHLVAGYIFYYRTLCRHHSQAVNVLAHCVAHLPAYQIYHALKDSKINERIAGCFE